MNGVGGLFRFEFTAGELNLIDSCRSAPQKSVCIFTSLICRSCLGSSFSQQASQREIAERRPIFTVSMAKATS